ncbi:uncharacterized protein LOC124899517 [Capsicum annuum]|uniref:uncharacterized protein LOC124899517 n=1 Tax=Capsicum annuum TaxID=4072 RepID=UPI001FB0C39B|nr:uncharacterized protein LOC124899517 [Capsicum annuum]
MDELIGNMKTHELKKKQGEEKKKEKKEILSLNPSNSKSSEDDTNVSYLEKRIIGAMKKISQFQRRGSSSKMESRGEKVKKKEQVPKKPREKVATDYVVKQDLVVWGDSSSETEKGEKLKDVSMLRVEDENITFDYLFALMENTEDEEENEIYEIEEHFTKLKSKILSLKNQLKKVDDFDGNGKKEASRLQIEFG